MKTHHVMLRGDARRMSDIPDGSVHLVVTSPPYWTLKQYGEGEAQLGNIESYTDFLDELDLVWKECLRVLVPGGRLCVNVGDVLLSRRYAGRHMVMPLHGDISSRCVSIGLDYLAPIIWHKISNIKLEASNSCRYLGKPNEPNGIVKNDIEYILFFRKGGAYRRPTEAMRAGSMIDKDEYAAWFRQIWEDLPGTSNAHHPAPFPEELAYRLVRMFSFVGDLVLDPFSGAGTTSIAATKAGRNSVSYEVDARYFVAAQKRWTRRYGSLFDNERLYAYDVAGTAAPEPPADLLSMLPKQ